MANRVAIQMEHSIILLLSQILHNATSVYCTISIFHHLTGVRCFLTCLDFHSHLTRLNIRYFIT